MGLLDKLKNLISPSSDVTTKSKSTPYSGVSGAGFGLFAGIAYNGTPLENNGTVFSVISRLSNSMAGLPIQLMKSGENQTSNVSRVIDNPNFNITGFELISKLETDRNTYGNGYALIRRDKYLTPIEIWPVSPLRVSPKIDTETGKLFYAISGDHGMVIADSDDVIHVKHVTGAARYIGISPLDVLKGTLGYDEIVTKYAVDQMTKVDSFKISYQANVSDDKKQAVYDSIEMFIANNGGGLFEEPGVEINEIKRDVTTTAVKENDEITRKRIANVFNFPLSFVNDSNGSSASTNEQDQLRFVTGTLLPIIKQYETQFNRKLLSEKERTEGLYWHFNVNSLLRADAATRGLFYTQMRRNSGISANEIRELEDMPRSKQNGADDLNISGDLYPLDLPVAERKAGSTVGRPSSDPNSGNDEEGGKTDDEKITDEVLEHVGKK